MANARFNKRAQARFLKAFAEWGMVTTAAAAAGVSTTTIRDRRKKDPEFEEAYTNTLELFRDELETEVLRRAFDGVEEDKYYKGVHSHTITNYSDRLAELAIKRHRPEYRDKIAVDATIAGGLFVLPAADMSSEKWEKDGND